MYFKKQEAGGFIGRGGENINQIYAQAGCRIDVDKEGTMKDGLAAIKINTKSIDMYNKVVSILVDCPQLTYLQAQDGRVLKDTVGRDPRSMLTSDRRGDHMEELWVPDRLVGLCIGKRGETLLGIERATGTKCNVHKFCPPGRRERCVEIHGPPSGIEEAKWRIEATIGRVANEPLKIVACDFDFQDQEVLEIIRQCIDYREI